MRWSWKIGEVSGIGIYVHATFLLIVGWVLLTHWVEHATIGATLAGIAFVLVLFGCVVLHELGHALTARKYGIRTSDITLLPIGGVARLERMPDEPRQELWVALGGPLVSLAIGVALILVAEITTGLQPLSQLSVATGSFVERVAIANLTLAAFNMIPAFPMDGGRVVRALLAMRMEYTRATQLAAGLGQALAFVFGFIGLLTNPFLLFIALFVWIGASQESSAVQMRSSLAGIPVARAMLTDFRTLRETDRLAHAVDLVLSGSQQDFPVVENETVVGILTRADLLVALSRSGPDAAVAEVMLRDFTTIDSHDMLEAVSRRIQECQCHTVPVVHGTRLVGLVTMDNLGEFLMIRTALRRSEAHRRQDASTQA